MDATGVLGVFGGLPLLRAVVIVKSDALTSSAGGGAVALPPPSHELPIRRILPKREVLSSSGDGEVGESSSPPSIMRGFTWLGS